MNKPANDNLPRPDPGTKYRAGNHRPTPHSARPVIWNW